MPIKADVPIADAAPADLLSGVIEGFYGKPWTQAERCELLQWMEQWGLNTYLYAPKDDLKHRALWRELYSVQEAQQLRFLIQQCERRKVRFIYAISPGLDIRYSDPAELEKLRRRLEQMAGLGCQHFALLFDDIPDRMEAADRARFGSFASAQCHIANSLCEWRQQESPGSLFLFCPTPYCGRMAQKELGGKDYLTTIGRELLPKIDVFWTGPEIISREISVAHIQELQNLLRRKPLIWDNLHANDYDGRRFFCGPYSGRPPELRGLVRGFLSNPNNEFPLNFVPLRTLAQFVQSTGPWDPRKEYLSAMQEWAPRFATITRAMSNEDLTLLGDCYYLPHENGAEAQLLFEAAKTATSSHAEKNADELRAFRKKALRLRDCCASLSELSDRNLFYALSRRIWELREELDLLTQYTAQMLQSHNQSVPVTIDSHLPGTYRGGIVSQLQRLLVHHRDGTFNSNPTE